MRRASKPPRAQRSWSEVGGGYWWVAWTRDGSPRLAINPAVGGYVRVGYAHELPAWA